MVHPVYHANIDRASAESRMLLVLIVLAFTSTTYGDEGRIVKGYDAEEGEFPFVVSLRYKNSHTCGGTILNENYILTAAHCVCRINGSSNDPKPFSVQYDQIQISNDTTNTVNVEKIHCNFNQQRTIINDWAVLKLEHPLPKGKWKPVELSENFDTSQEQKGTIVGWGKIAPDGPLSKNLQKLDVIIYDDELCGDKYNTEHNICFGADDGGACNGDSGTALLVDGVQVGIASFITDVCGIANKKHPNVYARVEAYHQKIKELAHL